MFDTVTFYKGLRFKKNQVTVYKGFVFMQNRVTSSTNDTIKEKKKKQKNVHPPIPHSHSHHYVYNISGDCKSDVRFGYPQENFWRYRRYHDSDHTFHGCLHKMWKEIQKLIYVIPLLTLLVSKKKKIVDTHIWNSFGDLMWSCTILFVWKMNSTV